MNISGEITIGGNTLDIILHTASKLRQRYPEITFHFYVGDATPVKECLDFGSLDFAVLLSPADTSKYDFIELPCNTQWGILMKNDDPLAQKGTIDQTDLLKLPLIMHRRIELQQQLAHWYVLIWKRNVVFSKASKAFLDLLKSIIKESEQ